MPKIEGHDCWEPKPGIFMSSAFWTYEEAKYYATTGTYTPEMVAKLSKRCIDDHDRYLATIAN